MSTCRPTRPGLVAPRRRDASGRDGPTANDVRAGRWRRTGHGLYVPRDVDGTVPEQRIVEAAAHLPAGAAITGWAALRWLGVRWCDGLAPGRRCRDVVIASEATDARSQPGVLVTGERLDPAEIVVVDGLPITSAVRSTCFEMRYAASVRAAVVPGDAALAARLCTLAELTSYVEEHPGWTGIRQAREALGLLVTTSWSPQETLVRLVWELDAGLPRPLCNAPVFDLRGNHVATPDLLDPVAGLVVEYDGLHHLGARQRRRDVDRESAMRDAGLEVVTVATGEGHRADVVRRRILAGRSRARWAPASERAWTLEVPPWWRGHGSR